MPDCWNPEQYHKFKNERSRPFYDLLNLVEKKPDMQVIDLGCGTGELTKVLHEELGAIHTLGIDASQAMLAHAPKASGLQFELKKIEDFIANRKFDLVFSNAALQWLPEHQKLIPKLVKLLKSDGQIAIQIPCSFELPTHTIASKVASKYLAETRPLYALSMEEYSKIFYETGLKKQIVQAKIYPLLLDSAISAYEWVKGTLLTYYQKHLTDKLFDQFTQEYRAELQNQLGKGPIFLPFKRLLFWGKF